MRSQKLNRSGMVYFVSVLLSGDLTDVCIVASILTCGHSYAGKNSKVGTGAHNMNISENASFA